MVDLVTVASSAYYFAAYMASQLLSTLMTGNQEAIGRLVLSLLVIWLLLVVTMRLARALYSTVVFAFKLALVVAAAFLGMSFYVNGVSVTLDTLINMFGAVSYDNAVQLAADVAAQAVGQGFQENFKGR